jgi:hypothetical protein
VAGRAATAHEEHNEVVNTTNHGSHLGFLEGDRGKPPVGALMELAFVRKVVLAGVAEIFSTRQTMLPRTWRR